MYGVHKEGFIHSDHLAELQRELQLYAQFPLVIVARVYLGAYRNYYYYCPAHVFIEKCVFTDG